MLYYDWQCIIRPIHVIQAMYRGTITLHAASRHSCNRFHLANQVDWIGRAEIGLVAHRVHRQTWMEICRRFETGQQLIVN